jgi:O-antigen/teichoic acid export membrane protein
MILAVRSDQDHRGPATRRVVKNTAYLVLADAAGKAMSFLFYMLAARHLGAGMFGVFSFALAFVTMLGVLTDLGLGALATREIARDPAKAQQHASAALAIRVVASAVVIVLIGVMVNVIGYPRTTVRVVYVLSSFVLANAVSSYYCSVFQGVERMQLVTLSRFAQTIVLVAGAALLTRGAAAVEPYALLYSGAGFVSALVAGTTAAGFVRPRLNFVLGEWRKVLSASAPIGLAVMFTMFYYWNGTTLLSKMRGSDVVGNYSAALRLVMGVAFVGFAFSGAVYPLLARLFTSDPARSGRVLELAIRYMIMLTLPVAAFGALFARPFITLLYGAGYEGAVSLLRILGWWAVFASLNSLLSNFFICANRPGTVTIQTGLALAVNVALNFALIPVMGAAGAAVSLVAAEAGSLCLLATLHLRSPTRVQARSVLGSTLRVMAAMAVAAPVAAVAARWGIVAGLAAGMVLYVLLLLVAGAVSRDDWVILRLLLRNGDA